MYEICEKHIFQGNIYVCSKFLVCARLLCAYTRAQLRGNIAEENIIRESLYFPHITLYFPFFPLYYHLLVQLSDKLLKNMLISLISKILF